jgi:ribonuclease P protein component
MGVSVKRILRKLSIVLFQTSVARNLSFKQTLLIDNQPTVFFYVFLPTKDRLTYEEINTKTIQLFEKLLLKTLKPAS